MSFEAVPPHPAPEQRYSRLAMKVARLEAEVKRLGETLRDSMAAVARPGDTVLLAFNRELTDEDIELLTESFQELKERGIEVGFTDQVAEIVVARPGVLDPDEEAFEARAASDDDIDDWGGA